MNTQEILDALAGKNTGKKERVSLRTMLVSLWIPYEHEDMNPSVDLHTSQNSLQNFLRYASNYGSFVLVEVKPSMEHDIYQSVEDYIARFANDDGDWISEAIHAEYKRIQNGTSQFAVKTTFDYSHLEK